MTIFLIENKVGCSGRGFVTLDENEENFYQLERLSLSDDQKNT